jgi:hypothetical protein
MRENLQNSLLLITYMLGPIVLLGALIYGTMAWRRRRRDGMEAVREAATRQAYEQDEARTEVSPAQPARRASARLSEDDQARAMLGGTRGAPQLGEAPMVPQQEKNTPRQFEPGHTA